MRELRLAGGLTQDDLAERCGLFRTYLSRIETGRANPTLTMIDALASSLGVPIVALFGVPETRALIDTALKGELIAEHEAFLAGRSGRG